MVTNDKFKKCLDQVSLGDEFQYKGLFDEAVKEYKEAIKIDPNCQPANLARIGLGDCYNSKGLFDEAIKIFSEALEKGPDATQIHHGLGAAFYRKGLYDDAIKELNIAIRMAEEYIRKNDPDLLGKDCNKEFKNELAELRKRGEFRSHRFISLWQMDMMITSHLSMGCIHVKKNLLNEAIKEFRKGLEIAPRDIRFHASIAETLVQKGELDEAINEYRIAISLNPKDEELHFNLGLTFHIKGQFDQAIKEYKETIKINKHFARANYWIGVAFLKKGFFDKVFEQLNILLKLDVELGTKLGNLISTEIKKTSK